MRQRYITILGFLFVFGLIGCRSTSLEAVPSPSTSIAIVGTAVPPSSNPIVATPETAAPAETQTWASPDGVWTATQGLIAPYERDGQEWFQASLVVRNTTDGREWVVVDEERGYGLGFEAPILYQWSADQSALYYSSSIVGDGCGLFAYNKGLYAVDLATGKQTKVAPARTRFLALSSDESRVAYEDETTPTEVVVRVLATSAEQRFTLPALAVAQQVGEFTWTPDNQYLLFIVATNACDPGDWRHSIYSYNPATGDVTPLVADAVEQFHIRTVDTEAAILVDQNQIIHKLDILTGELSAVP